MINNRRRWSLLAMLGSVVLLLAGTGLFLIVRHDARATPSLPASQEPPPALPPTPAAVSSGPDRIDVFALGANGQLLHKRFGPVRTS
jgi:hypothetical protein